MVYAPIGRAFKVNMAVIKNEKVKAWWFNPRNGKATEIGEFNNRDQREFTPPDLGEQLDWVLVLDDMSQNYPPPGQSSKAATPDNKRSLLVTSVRTGDT
jgi:hypothetical protein